LPQDEPGGRATRSYTSPRRRKQAAETKGAVLEAARELFSERGWSNTGIRDVAGGAGVSVETVYALFGSKPGLFQAAFDVAIAADLDAVPVAQRPEFLALAEGATADRTRAAARMVGRIHDDAAGLEKALREAAASDPGLGRLLSENEERRRADVQRGFEMVNGRRPTPTERDGCWALLSFEVYDLLVQRSGWSLPRYEEWLAGVLTFLAGGERTSAPADPDSGHQPDSRAGRGQDEAC
jgi:AcrR family transcriptional regulator